MPNLRFELFFEKLQLLPTSFGSQSVLKVRLRIRDKTNTIFQVYLLKNHCWNLPFRKSPLFAVATSSDWWRTASSRRFGVGKHRFPPKSYTSRTCITFGGKRALLTPNLLELAIPRQSLEVATANNGVFRKGKFQQRFFSKYTWKMAFVLSRIRSGTLRTRCEPKDVGNSCDFSKKIVQTRDLVQHILDYIT